MSFTPPPSESDPEDGFPEASDGDVTEPVPEADAPTLVTGKPVEPSEPTLAQALVEGGEEPVFVDVSGRRRAILRRVGIGIGVLAAAYIALLVVSLAGGPRPPGIPLPEAIAGDADQSQTKPDGSAPGTPATRPSKPTPGSSPSSTTPAEPGSTPARPSASPTLSGAPPGAAVPPAPVFPTATPTPTPASPAPTPASPTPTPESPTPLQAPASPAVIDSPPAGDPTGGGQP
jgi:hypothetical protein